jgi:hypothetical protein
MTPQDMAKKISERFAELNKMGHEAQQRLAQAQADINSIQGAQLDCQYWLAEVAKANPPAFVPDGTPQALPSPLQDVAPSNDDTQDNTIN